MTWTRRSLIVACFCGLPLVAAKKDKEEPARTVKGIVTDEAENPLKRAVVQLKNTRTLEVKSFYSGPDGRFYFAGLDPNVDYEIKADYEGFKPKTRRVSSFENRMELFYQFTLKPE